MRSSDKINKPHIAVLSQKPNSLLLYGVHWNHATAIGTFHANSFINFFIALFVSHVVFLVFFIRQSLSLSDCNDKVKSDKNVLIASCGVVKLGTPAQIAAITISNTSKVSSGGRPDSDIFP